VVAALLLFWLLHYLRVRRAARAEHVNAPLGTERTSS